MKPFSNYIIALAVIVAVAVANDQGITSCDSQQ